MREARSSVLLRDATLREGLDTPGVSFTRDQRATIARALAAAGVRELEVVAPSRVETDVALASAIRDMAAPARLSGLIYASAPSANRDIHATLGVLDRIDLLMPLAAARPPATPEAKRRRLLDVLEEALAIGTNIGVGFPHSTQVDAVLVADFAASATAAGAHRVTLYDTNGSASPASVRDLVGGVCRSTDVEVFYHGHNDLGLATANALAAIEAGAHGLDVTVNGLGDRAGNVALEQVAVALWVAGHTTGVTLTELAMLSAIVDRESGVPVSPLAPVVGQFAIRHRSPGHLPYPHLFEAYAPELIGTARAVDA